MPIDNVEGDRQRRNPLIASRPMVYSPILSMGTGYESHDPIAELMRPQQSASPMSGVIQLQMDYSRPQHPSRLVEALMRLNNNQASGY